MKKETKEKLIENAGEITWTIIGIIARIPEAMIGSFIDHKEINNRFSDDYQFLADKLVDHLRNLKQRGYIEIEKINGSLSIRLTTKGKIKNLENPNNTESDGRLRVISFDIPEIDRTKRQRLCRTIKRIGYRRLQKSLWVCKYNKADEIDLVLDELNIRDFVAYFIIDVSNVDDHVKKLLE